MLILALAWGVSEHLAEDLRLNPVPGCGVLSAERMLPASDEEHPRAHAPPLPVPCIGTALAL
jgi:hypothetical protein